MATKRTSSASNRDASADVRAEFVTLAGLAASGGLGVAVGEKAYRFLKSPEPLVVQVLISEAVPKLHRAAFKFTNQTVHGIYIEHLAATHVHLDIDLSEIFLRERVTGDGWGFAEMQWVGRKPAAFEPQYIEPGQSLDLAVEIPLLSKDARPYATLLTDYSRLDEQAITKGKKTVFRIRW